MKFNNNKGFTLVEIIVALTILGILAAFTIPAMLGYIEKARIIKATDEVAYVNRNVLYQQTKYAFSDKDLHGYRSNNVFAKYKEFDQSLFQAIDDIAKNKYEIEIWLTDGVKKTIYVYYYPEGKKENSKHYYEFENGVLMTEHKN